LGWFDYLLIYLEVSFFKSEEHNYSNDHDTERNESNTVEYTW